MADLVQKWSEEKIPQYEQLIRVGIFSEEEIKAIIKKTTSLEYKLVRRVKVKEDFLSYIQYNIHVLSLIKKRRKRINYFLKKDEIEYAIVSRIHRIFKQCTFRWPEDLKLWSSHIEFCKQWNKNIQLSKIWTAMLQFHGNTSIDLWTMAAKWEYEDNHSVDNARQIFLRGIRHFPEEPKLWQEYFKLELIHVMKTRQRLALLTKDDDQESVTEDYLKGEVAKIVYNNAISALPKQSAIKCDFLELAIPFAFFAGEIINMIIEDLVQNHEKDALARSALARLHLNPAMMNLANDDSSVGRVADVWAAEKRCWEDFETAVEEVDSPEMWQQYISFLSSRVDIGKSADNVLSLDSSPVEKYASDRLNKLFAVLDKGHRSRKLSSPSYLKYVEHLVRAEKLSEAVNLLKDCLEYEDVISLRLKLLELASRSGVEFNIDFIKASVKVLLTVVESMDKEQEECFWTSWIEYAKNTKVLDFLWEGLKESRIRHSRFVADFALACFDLTMCTDGLEEAIDIYKSRLRFACPNSLELFNKVVTNLKKTPAHHGVSKKLFESAVNDLGKSSPGFWLIYIKNVMNHDPTGVSALHWKAMKTLDSDLVSKFSEGYAMLQAKKDVDELITLQ